MSKKIIVTTRGGIGDVLLCTPALRAVKECNRDRKLIVYCLNKAHRDVLLNNPYIDSVRLIPPLYLWRYPYHLFCYLFNKRWNEGYMFNPDRLKHYRLTFQHIPLSWVYEKSAKEVIPEIFADLNVKLNYKNIELFFTRKEEDIARRKLAPYRNVVLIHVYSTTSQNHLWQTEKWESLVKEMPEFTFIQIGNSNDPYVKGALDWRSDKNSVRDAFCLMKYATSFVGVESCMAHATNAFDLPGVVLFGDSSPVRYGHDNNINIYKKVWCAPCFHYVQGHPCPYGHECMKLITVREVKDAIIRQVNGRPSRHAQLTADLETFKI